MGLITFNGKSSADYGFEVTRPPQHNYPKRLYEKIIVPGKDGEVIYDVGSYSNVKRDYDISAIATTNYEELSKKIGEFLHSGHGYLRLEDTYEPDYYREACFEDEASLSNIYHQGGTMSFSLNCKPACWLKSGETAVSLVWDKTEDSTIWYNLSLTNPTINSAYPLICVDIHTPYRTYLRDMCIKRVDSNSDYSSTDHQISIDLNRLGIGNVFYVDMKNKNIYWNRGSLNQYINLNDTTDYFYLRPSVTDYIKVSITYQGGKEIFPNDISIQITPRWWVI